MSLVDPDSRRPIDYETRSELLKTVLALPKQKRNAAVLDMLDNWQDGRIKLAVIETLLAYRRDNPMLFARGGNQALTAAGSEADRICAFARRKEEDALIVVVARFPVRCEGERDWGGTEINWPHAVEGDAVWRDLFTARAVERHRETFDVRTVLEDMPVADLVPENGG